MIASKVKIIQTHGHEVNYTDVDQLYTIGNFLLIGGKVQDTLLDSNINHVNDKYRLVELKTMIVEFGKE